MGKPKPPTVFKSFQDLAQAKAREVEVKEVKKQEFIQKQREKPKVELRRDGKVVMKWQTFKYLVWNSVTGCDVDGNDLVNPVYRDVMGGPTLLVSTILADPRVNIQFRNLLRQAIALL